jgi:hypothetical protein
LLQIVRGKGVLVVGNKIGLSSVLLWEENSMRLIFAPSAGLAPVLAVAMLAAASTSSIAQNNEHEWQKDYPLSGRASLTVETGDSHLNIHSCGDCKAIQIRVNSGRSLSQYVLEERQEGNHVFFTLKEKPHVVGMFIHWNAHETTQVSVGTPASLELDARTADGNLSVSGLTGNLNVHSGDGSVSLEDVHGDLRLKASDGNVTIHNASGTIDARGSDGHMKIDGKFTAVNLRTSDGSLDFSLLPGSQLTAASSIESSDGHVSILVPQNLSADLDVSASDGRIDCKLPITTDHYDSSESSGHHLHGHLNAGGVALSVHTSDGNLSIASL